MLEASKNTKKNLKDLPILLSDKSKRKRSKYKMNRYFNNVRVTLDGKEIRVPKKFREIREQNEWYKLSGDTFILLFSFFTIILIIFTFVAIPNDSKLAILFGPLTTICCLITLTVTIFERKWFLAGIWTLNSIVWIIQTILIF